MPEIVAIRFPVYKGETRKVEVKGETVVATPFVEMWKYFDVPKQELLKVRPQVNMGLRILSSETDYSDLQLDPIRLYRALKILDKFDHFIDPYEDLRDIYAAAGFNSELRFHHYVRRRIRENIGNEAHDEILQMTPPNLQQVVENFRKNRLLIEGRTLQRDIRRGLVESTPLYERVIQEAKARDIRMTKGMERFLTGKYSFM